MIVISSLQLSKVHIGGFICLLSKDILRKENKRIQMLRLLLQPSLLHCHGDSAVKVSSRLLKIPFVD